MRKPDISQSFWVEKCKLHSCAFEGSCYCQLTNSTSIEHHDVFRSHLRTLRGRQASQWLQQIAEGRQSLCEGVRKGRWRKSGQVSEERDHVSRPATSFVR